MRLRDYSIELISAGRGDCGCPEEEYLFDSFNLTLHFEPDGAVDGFIDGGDEGEAETELRGLTPFAGRLAIFAWAARMIHGPAA